MSEPRLVQAHDPKYIDRILRMKPKQIEELWRQQRRKAGTDTGR